MARFLHSIYSFTFRKYDKLVLALSWVLGLGFGGFVFRYAGSDLVSQMPLAVTCQPSIFGLLTSSLLPFLFSAFAVFICVPGLLFGICFLKAFLLGYISCGVFAAFGGSGWLICRLLLFTDLCSAVCLYFYWHRQISGVRGFSILSLLGCVVPVLIAAGTDFYYISPLLRRLLS